MKKQSLNSTLKLSKKVISNLQSESLKGGGTQICPTTAYPGHCDQAPTDNGCNHK